MKFEGNRLFLGTNGFYSYKDPYGTPYAYFSSYNAEGDPRYLPPQYNQRSYGRYAAYTPPSDCGNLGVAPYYSPNNRYLNAKSFQIISAGPDKTFGPGGLFAPGGGIGPAADDMCNFFDSLIGTQ